MKKGNVLKKILIIAAVALGLLFAISAIMNYTENGGELNVKTFSVTVNGKTYSDDASDVAITPNTEIKLNSLFKDTGISIYAAETKTDLSFKMDGDVYAWNDLVNAQKELSTGFNVTETKDGYSLSFTSLSALLSDVFNTDVTVSGDSSTALFVMHLTNGDSVIKLTFSAEFGAYAEVIEFSSILIIF